MAGVGFFRSARGRERYFACYDEAMALSPMPRSRHDVDVSYGRVRVYRHGPDGRAPIVLLHGRGATSAMWEPNIRALAATHPVFAVDVLGEPGASMQTVPVRNGADHAGWLEETLAALSLDAVHLVGASAGGWPAFQQAVHHPFRLASITLLEPAQTLARFRPGFVLGAVTATPGLHSPLTDLFLRWVSSSPPMDTPVARLLTTGMREYRTHLPMPTYAGDDVLRGVRVPVLALLGGRSVAQDPVTARRRSQLLPCGEAEIWPEASHAISGEAADRVNQRVLRFVDGHSR